MLLQRIDSSSTAETIGRQDLDAFAELGAEVILHCIDEQSTTVVRVNLNW
jgi:hypothetical protein